MEIVHRLYFCGSFSFNTLLNSSKSIRRCLGVVGACSVGSASVGCGNAGVVDRVRVGVATVSFDNAGVVGFVRVGVATTGVSDSKKLNKINVFSVFT